MIILLTRIILHNFAVFATKKIWIFISYTVHRNKLIDMFFNNINGVINKNFQVFLFFYVRIKLAWKAKQKQRELTKNQFFLFLFFLKIQDIKKPKTPIFERGSIKVFGSSVDHFSNKPICSYITEFVCHAVKSNLCWIN